MENNLLFSAEPAERINAEFRKIDPRLFLFCNYAPLPPTGDVQLDVFQGAMNLYRVTVDSIPLWPMLRPFFRKRKVKKEELNTFNFSPYIPPAIQKTLKTADNWQNHLRAYLAHNNHAANGKTQEDHIAVFSQWEADVTDNAMLTSPEGCRLAMEHLLELANALEQALLTMVAAMQEVQGSDRDALVEAFVDQCIYWYTENSRQGMLLDLLDDLLNDSANQGMIRSDLMRKYLIAANPAAKPEIDKIGKYSVLQRKFFDEVKNDLKAIAPHVGSLLPHIFLDAFCRYYM